MWKRFSLEGNDKWFDILPELIAEYNNTVHRSTGMKPKGATLEYEEYLVKLPNKSNYKIKNPKFKVGDHVCVSKLKPIFEKGYTLNQSFEIFTVEKVQKTRPITYKLKDYQNQSPEGCFYEFELLKAKVLDVNLNEKEIN